MTFKEAFMHYKDGTATDEERQLVETELEKSRLITEYLDEQWETALPAPTAPDGEIGKVRKSLRKRNVLLVLTSLILAAALLLGTIYVVIPALESAYWDPATASYGTFTDLELMLAAQTELFSPRTRIDGIQSTKTGFAAYNLTIRYWDPYHFTDLFYTSATLAENSLILPQAITDANPLNLFDRATYPFYETDESQKQSTADTLSVLPEYVTVLAAVSFTEDMSMEEILALESTLNDGSLGWIGIRTSPENEQLIPLCGMDVHPYGKVRTGANDAYPCLDIKGMEITPEVLETHFISLLRFSADQVAAGTGIDRRYRIDTLYYDQVLDFVEENGIYSYGCYITGTPETFLALLESGAVSQVIILDAWLDI